MTTPPAAKSPVAGAAPTVPGAPGTGPRVHNRSTWGLTWRGVRTVIVLELRQRVRSTRWWIVLVVWAVVLTVLTALIHNAIMDTLVSDYGSSTDRQQAGAIVFGSVVLLVLSLGGLVAPAITATSINGDRSAGVLATLQSTLLTPAEIALGKLLAGWATSMALLVVALPFLGWAYLDGGTPFPRLAVTTTLLALLLVVVTAIGLGISALAARAATSAVLTYLVVAALGIGLPLLFALSMHLVTQPEPVEYTYPVWDDSGEWTGRYVTEEETREVTHTERIWWLLAANPYVVIADASPLPDWSNGYDDDPLTLVRSEVRKARLGPSHDSDYSYSGCGGDWDCEQEQDQARANALPPSWPYGLAANLVLGAGGFILAVRRLRAPARKLPRGTRVA